MTTTNENARCRGSEGRATPGKRARHLASMMLSVAALTAATPVHAWAYGSRTAARERVTRNTCFTRNGGGDMGRQMGARNAKRLVDAVWTRLGRGCDRVDQLAQIIADTPLQRSAGAGAFGACFYVGYTDALWMELGNIYGRCGDACFNAGADIGSISAQGYCYASMAVGGLDDPGFIAQPPLPFCGFNVSIGCKSEYVYTATTAIPACRTFTQGYFLDTFENSVRQDCFLPSDVPITDGLTWLN